ncbi:MAG TPA: M13 family metallopeptidase N-terminal domain-containing protein, partial [Chitinophagaceae bacterium]|nr:M13 family metallopeptidase N-terminal domain-containing protein [Chitinophagaceae bacterium]
MQFRNLLTAVTVFLLLTACNQPEKKEVKPDFLAANIDTTINPAEDFFLYANGGWIKKTPIPESESGWGIGNLVNEEIYDRKKKINENAVKENAAEGTTSQKIADFWISGMDTVDIEKQQLKPLQADMDKIEAIKSVNDLILLTAAFHNKGVDVLFGEYAGQDQKNSDVIAYQLGQAGLGMPNRDYYFNTDERTAGVRKAYQVYLNKTFQQMGSDSASAAKTSAAVFALETKLAKASRKLADLRDPYKNYNKMSVAELGKLTSNINWSVYLPAVGVKKIDSVIVGQPEFLTALNHELTATSISDWKNYFRFQLVQSSAAYLDKQTFTNLFEYRKSLTGAKEPRPRWKRVLDAEEGAIGEALGQLFVKEYFNETAKKRYSDLVEAIRDAYKERIKNLSWMSDSTKAKAYDKLAKITKKVGYPDKWKDFSALKID